MNKLEERENRRKGIIGNMVSQPVVGTRERGRPKEERELKKRISLSILPSLYDDIQKIAYVQRKSASELIASILEEYRKKHRTELSEYDRLI